ncbi:MAG: bifunctional phosphoribosylaminoimidazolecarboxamide formyltransferase/IMP cyclohydrolase [Chloroflexi bacterium]|nr:bifunctional phosphoribosylaminoimidazolecarboxamide formyltransferase/IMP cyclohydrolase [Chloroflexota bacterium]
MKKIALLSAYDRRGIVDFANVLVQCGYEIVSTGGTGAELSTNGINVTEVSELTGSPEMLDGRVKTLHPKIHGGLLALRDDDDHLQQMERWGIRGIDLVVNNLYPFVETVRDPDVSLKDALENIDIGGPAMTRAAAKNYPHVVIVVDPNDYDRVGQMIRDGDVPQTERRRLASKAFQHVAVYDTAIASHLRHDPAGDDAEELPNELTFGYELVARPRYGENPHQRAGIYSRPGEEGGVVNAQLLHGIDMSYLNYFDADAAWAVATSFAGFSAHTAVVVKHANPCGLAARESQPDAWEAALEGDPVSAFGGIVAFSEGLTAETAQRMHGLLLDVIVAPEYESEALEILRKRRRTRVLRVKPNPSARWEVRSVSGGALVQEPDVGTDDGFRKINVVTDRQPTEQEIDDLRFAWRACRFIKSNAIVFAKNRTLVGMGAGQPNRVTSVHLSARVANEKAAGSVMASDAFFPFPDGIEEAVAAGVTAVIQPGGSIGDDAVIDAANELGIAMVFTGKRHFYH